MKAFWKDFLLRGLICAAGGPVVLAIVYGILGISGVVESLSPTEVCTGVLTIAALAFVVAGMTAIYQLEQLPLATKILLHGGVLYLVYILTYLCNGWLESQWLPIVIFTAIFLVCYGVIWLIIYLVEKRKADEINKLLQS